MGSFRALTPLSLTPESSREPWGVQTSVSELEFPLNVNTRGMEIRHMLCSNGRDPAALQVSDEQQTTVRAVVAAFAELQRVQLQCVQADCGMSTASLEFFLGLCRSLSVYDQLQAIEEQIQTLREDSTGRIVAKGLSFAPGSSNTKWEALICQAAKDAVQNDAAVEIEYFELRMPSNNRNCCRSCTFAHTTS